MIKSLILIFQFLTRLPIPIAVDADEQTFKDGIYFFTVVGALLGAILLAVNSILATLHIDLWSSAILLTIVHIFTTGGLHLDGIADTSDALFSNRSKQRMLEILRDSRIGSNGVLALIITLSLKAVGIHFVISNGFAIALLMMPIVGRFCVVLSFYWGKTPRSSGMGNLFIGNAKIGHILANALVPLTLLVFVVTQQFNFLIAIIICIIYVVLVIHWSTQKIGGITGDLLGFIIESSEVVFVLSMMLIIAIGGAL